MKNRNRMIVNCVTASLMYYWSLPALAEQSSSEIKIVRDEYGKIGRASCRERV